MGGCSGGVAAAPVGMTERAPSARKQLQVMAKPEALAEDGGVFRGGSGRPTRDDGKSAISANAVAGQ